MMELQCLTLPNFYSDKYKKKNKHKNKTKKIIKQNRVFVGITSIANFKRFILTCNQKRKSEIT